MACEATARAAAAPAEPHRRHIPCRGRRRRSTPEQRAQGGCSSSSGGGGGGGGGAAREWDGRVAVLVSVSVYSQHQAQAGLRLVLLSHPLSPALTSARSYLLVLGVGPQRPPGTEGGKAGGGGDGEGRRQWPEADRPPVRGDEDRSTVTGRQAGALGSVFGMCAHACEVTGRRREPVVGVGGSFSGGAAGVTCVRRGRFSRRGLCGKRHDAEGVACGPRLGV